MIYMVAGIKARHQRESLAVKNKRDQCIPCKEQATVRSCQIGTLVGKASSAYYDDEQKCKGIRVVGGLCRQHPGRCLSGRRCINTKPLRQRTQSTCKCCMAVALLITMVQHYGQNVDNNSDTITV